MSIKFLQRNKRVVILTTKKSYKPKVYFDIAVTTFPNMGYRASGPMYAHAARVILPNSGINSARHEREDQS